MTPVLLFSRQVRTGFVIEDEVVHDRALSNTVSASTHIRISCDARPVERDLTAVRCSHPKAMRLKTWFGDMKRAVCLRHQGNEHRTPRRCRSSSSEINDKLVNTIEGGPSSKTTLKVVVRVFSTIHRDQLTVEEGGIGANRSSWTRSKRVVSQVEPEPLEGVFVIRAHVLARQRR